MHKLLICTNNRGKLIEISYVLKKLPVEIVSLSDVGLDFEVDETGESYDENATLKVRTYGQKAKLLSIADDAGIEVSALNGAPGVHSRRFFKTDMEERNKELISMIKDKEDKRAKFVAVVAVFNPRDNSIKTFRGEENGILVETKGKARVDLGYDSIFFIPELKKTYAQLSLKEKSTRSHRGIAAKAAGEYIKTLL
jgi:XTP/dITP diphosphohydrolase